MTHRTLVTRAFFVTAVTLALLAARPAAAASLQAVANWGASGVPSYISMYIYVPDKPAANPPILVVSHYCGGSATAVFNQAKGGGIVADADKYGFIMIFPQTTNPATSADCWDVGSKASLTHDGGGDTQARRRDGEVHDQQVRRERQPRLRHGRLVGRDDDAGAAGGLPGRLQGGRVVRRRARGLLVRRLERCQQLGRRARGGNDTMTAQAWGDLARGMDPAYTGHRPRVQLFHGDADPTINYKNFGEAIKQWTNVLGLGTNPTSTTTGVTLGTHQATRQQWKNSCGYVVLDAFKSIGGDHGPSDALFDATYVVPFLGLDDTGTVDPDIALCGSGGGGAAGTAHRGRVDAAGPRAEAAAQSGAAERSEAEVRAGAQGAPGRRAREVRGEWRKRRRNRLGWCDGQRRRQWKRRHDRHRRRARHGGSESGEGGHSATGGSGSGGTSSAGTGGLRQPGAPARRAMPAPPVGAAARLAEPSGRRRPVWMPPSGSACSPLPSDVADARPRTDGQSGGRERKRLARFCRGFAYGRP